MERDNFYFVKILFCFIPHQPVINLEQLWHHQKWLENVPPFPWNFPWTLTNSIVRLTQNVFFSSLTSSSYRSATNLNKFFSQWLPFELCSVICRTVRKGMRRLYSNVIDFSKKAFSNTNEWIEILPFNWDPVLFNDIWSSGPAEAYKCWKTKNFIKTWT